MSMTTKSMLMILMFTASPVHGMVYTWTDSAGVSHFTNKEYEVPARYRARTKALYPEQADVGAPQNLQTAPPSEAQPPAQAQQAKPEGPTPTKSTQPVIAPGPPKRQPERATKKGRRSRVATDD